MTLIFVNRFFHPDYSATSQMASGMAFGLAAEGRRVTVITSRLRYDDPHARLPARENVGGVEIVRVPTSRFGRGGMATRAIDYLTFYGSASWALWRLARKGDVVIVKTDPPMLSLVANLAVRLRGAVLVNWLQDLFPEVATDLGLARGPISRAALGVLRGLRNRSLRSARVNVAIGERMAERLRALGLPPERIRVIPNWADGAVLTSVPHTTNPAREAAWAHGNAFVVGYSGNLGRAHDYQTMLDAMTLIGEQLAPAGDASTIAWVFVGGGAHYEKLRHAVAARRIAPAYFEPYRPPDQLADSLSAIDVHLVSLHPALEGLVVPSKTYGIAAVGRPILFIGDPDGEIARFIDQARCGMTVMPGDAAALARIITDLSRDHERCAEMGRNARAAFEKGFDKPIALAAWQGLLAELVDRPLETSRSR